MAFLHGLGFGLLMMLFIGPVFFYLVQVSLQYGAKPGIAAALGIFISDVTAVLLCYFWASDLFDTSDTTTSIWLAIVGGIILVVLGLNYIYRPSLPAPGELKISNADYATFFTKAFLINFVNPFVFVVWISMISIANANYPGTAESILFLSAVLLGIITTDTLKVLGSKYLRRVIQPHFLLKLYKSIGILLILFSLRAFYHAAKLYFEF